MENKPLTAEEWKIKNHYKYCKWDLALVDEYTNYKAEYLLNQFKEQILDNSYFYTFKEDILEAHEQILKQLK